MRAPERAEARPQPVMVGRSVLWGLCFAVAFVVLYVLAVLTPDGQQIDARSLGQFLWGGVIVESVFPALRVVIPAVLALTAVVIGGIALVRRQWVDVAVTAGCALLLIVASGPVRDDILVRPYLGDFAYLANSFPSRHIVVGLSLGMVSVRLWPWRSRDRIARSVIIALVALLAEVSVVTFAHRVSDVIGAALFVGVLAPVVARGRVPRLRRVIGEKAVALWLLIAAAVVSGSLAAIDVGGAVAFTVLTIAGVAAACIVVLRIAVDPSRSSLMASWNRPPRSPAGRPQHTP